MAQKKNSKEQKKRPARASKAKKVQAPKKKAVPVRAKALPPSKKAPIRAKAARAKSNVETTIASSAALRAQMQKLVSAKTPAEYIERSLKVKLTVPQKGYVTRLWLEKTGYTVKDIEYARNRNPYWKKLKSEGSLERNEKRFKMHDYREKKRKKIVAVEWNDDNLRSFIELTGKMADWQLAERFSTTIPAINHLRRKYNVAVRLLAAVGKPAGARTLVPVMRSSEGVLKRQLDQALTFKKKRR